MPARRPPGRAASEGDRRHPMSHANTPETPFVGMIKPSRRGSSSYDTLVKLLPPDIRTAARYAPVEKGLMSEFAAAIPAYENMVAAFAADGCDLVHAEGTPPFLILGHDGERRTVAAWEKTYGVPVFTSAMSQADALRALGVRRLVDAGYDPTTGPEAEAYFRAAGFDVLAVEKVPVAWGAAGEVSDDEAHAMLAGILRRHPGADGLCLQGSSKWRLSGLIARLERDFGIAVVHPVAARYWDLLRRLGRGGPAAAKPGLGRLLAEMPAG